MLHKTECKIHFTSPKKQNNFLIFKNYNVVLHETYMTGYMHGSSAPVNNNALMLKERMTKERTCSSLYSLSWPLNRRGRKARHIIKLNDEKFFISPNIVPCSLTSHCCLEGMLTQTSHTFWRLKDYLFSSGSNRLVGKIPMTFS